MYVSNVGKVAAAVGVRRRIQRQRTENLLVGERAGGDGAVLRQRREAGHRPLIGVSDRAAEGEATLQPAQAPGARHPRQQMLETAVGPAGENVAGQGGACVGRDARFFPKTLELVAPDVVDPDGAGIVVGDAPDLARQPVEEGPEVTRGFGGRRSRIEAGAQFEDAQLRPQRHQPPPALARVVAEGGRQAAGEERSTHGR
jgi:hypothetical protein